MSLKKDNICSICLENCSLKFCKYCNNYAHIECIKKYINNDYKSIFLYNNNSLSIKCFICKTNDSGFILTKQRFNYIFLDNLYNDDYEYLKYIHYCVNVMLNNNNLNHNICFELILIRIIESKYILYDKLDIFKEKINKQLKHYYSKCTYSNNLKLINYLIN